MAKDKKIKLGYKILKIHTTKFSFTDIDSDELTNLLDSKEDLGINVNVSLNINKDESTLTLDVSTQLIKTKDKVFLVEHSGRTVYFVGGLEGTFDKEKNVYNLPNDLLIQWYSIAYTHSRALLAIEISPTVYKDKYFLPVINPLDLLKLDKKEK